MEEKDREIQRLTQQLDATNNLQNDSIIYLVKSALQEILQRNNYSNYLVNVKTRNKLNLHTLQREDENRERLLEQLLQETKEREREQLQDSQERDIVLRQRLQ